MFPQQPRDPDGVENRPVYSLPRDTPSMSSIDSMTRGIDIGPISLSPRNSPSLSSTDYPRSEPSSSDREIAARRRYAHRGPPRRYARGVLDERNWESWTSLKVKLSGFQVKPNTWGIHGNVAVYGNVSSIEVDRINDVYVVFCPPPTEAIWRRAFNWTYGRDGRKCPITVSLMAHNRMVPSPVNPRVRYSEYMSLPLAELQFGFLHTENTMMIMRSITPPPDTRADIRLDLSRRELDVRFPLTVPSVSGVEQADVTMFRFQVPLPKVSTIHIETSESGGKAMILPLVAPPEFYRQTKDIETTHKPRDSRWWERLSWYRQTDIVEDLVQLEIGPVTLHNKDAIVDIGRWTTYRLVLSDQNHRLYKDFTQALKDWNVKLVEDEVKLIPRADIPVWHLLGGLEKPMAKASDMLLELSTGVKQLSFEVRYQLEVCISHGYLHESNISEEFLRKLAERDESIAVAILEQVADAKERLFNPMSIFELKVRRSAARKKIPPHCTLARSAVITPSTIYYTTPSVEISNRVVRHWSAIQDRFIRIRFTDELDNGRVQSQDNKIMDDVFSRIKRAMENGIVLGDRKFEYLASGNSQFRENGAYFFAPTPEWSTQVLRDHLGQMDPNDETIPAKFCARIGQNFSTTRGINTTVFVQDQHAACYDIERNGFNFTDGVGKISPDLARRIAEELGLPTEDPPSIYQFRLGGLKGVLAIAPDVRGNEVHIRPSQAKFAAIHEGLEIIRTSSYVTAFLNRQIILELSTLEVPDEVFRQKLDSQLANLTKAMVDEQVALSELQKSIDFNQMTLTIAGMIKAGFMRVRDPFMMSTLNLWRSWTVKYLKEKAKITIEQGACLLGCVDEFAVLKGHFNATQPSENASLEERIAALPEVFCYVDQKKTGIYEPIEGICIVARNPSLHPGDIRVVRAVNKPELYHLRNAVVLPQTGDRDLGNMCSGGDLDGDDYWIIWDQDLIPPPEEWNHPAMDFTAIPPRRIRDKVTVKDMTEFFVNYMKNDNLGQIAHAHLAQADNQEFGVKDDKCLALAQLHSQAVDFNKSGVPAKMPQDLRPKTWPHFMEKKHAKGQYHSEKILGQLYDMVKLVDFIPDYDAPFDERVLQAHEVSEEMLQRAAEIKEQYDTDIRRIMAQHDIDTEFEVWSTFVMSHNGEKRDYSFAEELGQIVNSIKSMYREICVKASGGDSFETLQPFVTAMYKATERQMRAALNECNTTKIVGGMKVPARKMDSKNMPLMSFPWVFDRELGMIASGIFYSSESVSRQQGTQKRTTKRATAAGPDNPDAIETADGVVPKGELIDFFQKDKHMDNDLPSPIRPQQDTEQARRIEAAIENRRDDSEYIKKRPRPIKEIPDHYEDLLMHDMDEAELGEDDEGDGPPISSGDEESPLTVGSQDIKSASGVGNEDAVVEIDISAGSKPSGLNKLAALYDSDEDEDDDDEIDEANDEELPLTPKSQDAGFVEETGDEVTLVEVNLNTVSNSKPAAVSKLAAIYGSDEN
ncbi:RdRP-domain-containing protein [Venturia nashicola]|uniref:RNA-dependent RNA polymerase n=1 Tax=Venturia nashicola TaxID=86259 RepID=A0A4Z1P1C1_9PEZI|nr:RdRP-domain-containing protein [Venturia nashicola]